MAGKQTLTVETIALGPARTTEDEVEQDFMDVKVYYALGGINYFNYKQEPRGYWVSVSIVTRGRRIGGGGFGFEKFGLADGKALKHFIEPAARFSAKRLAAIVPDPDVVADMKQRVLARHEEREEAIR